MSGHETVRVRIEEIVIGGLVGALVGYAAGLPLLLIAGMPQDGWSFFLLHADPAPAWARLLHVLLWVLGLVGACVGGWLACRQQAEVHLRGAKYFTDADQARDALSEIERPRMSPAQQRGERRGLIIGGVEFSRRRETEHGLLLGLPGGGKTLAVLRPTLDQVLARRGSRVLLHDPKSDFTASHYDPERAVLLGPWDDRAAVWDAAMDFSNSALIDEFAAGVCGVAESGQNRYFHAGAATILGGLMKSYSRAGRPWTWSMIAKGLSSDPITLIQKAAHGDALVMQAIPSVWSPSRGKIELTAGERGVISTLGNSSRMLMQLAAVDASRAQAQRFSIRRWLMGLDHQDIRLVILNNSALYSSAAAAIFGAILSVAKATISASLPEKSADDDDALWLLLDEARQLGAAGLESVQIIEEVGRSRGVRVWLALQDGAQLEAVVGPEKAGPMMSVQGTRVYLRAPPESADNLARTVGEREIMRIQSTASGGAVQGKTSTYDRVPVLLPGDLTSLGADRQRDGQIRVDMLLSIEDIVARVDHVADPRIPQIAPAQVPCIAWEQGAPVPSSAAPAPAPQAPAPGGQAPAPQQDPAPDADLGPVQGERAIDPDDLADLWR